MKRIYDTEKKCMMAIDGEYELELGACHNTITGWKKWYFKKNSKMSAAIRLRCTHSAPDPDHWKYYLELIRDEKLEQQYRICNEAYDVLKGQKVPESYPGVEFIELHEFKPTIKTAP